MDNMIVFTLFFIGSIFLQIFLSKRDSKWPGLVLPTISFFFSIIAILGMFFYGDESIMQVIIKLLMVFLVSNIPTSILVAIYFSCRGKVKKNKEIDKMNIQDL
jgi:hypothetical protein